MTGYPKQNGCEECIVYRIHHNQIEPEICPECGHKSLYWKQSRTGSLFARCSRCWLLVAVDLNTPCENDPIYYETTKIVIEPNDHKPDNQTVLRAAKCLNISGLKMREMLINGCVLALSTSMIDELSTVFNDNNIEYRIINPQDPRKKYPYYTQCNYLYSGMRQYLPETCHEPAENRRANRKNHQICKLSIDDVYKQLCESIPENKEICEKYIVDYGLDGYPFAFSCIYEPMMEAYRQGKMDLFRKYSEFVELVMDQGEESIALAVDDEVVDRLELDEPSDVWDAFRKSVSSGFSY